MTVDRDQFKALAAEWQELQAANKDKVDVFMERVGAAGLDPAGLRRFVSWKKQDQEKRAQREAVDQQCRYLAGERDTPAALPIGCELARALNCYRRNMTVRQTAVELGVSHGKAGKLRDLARMFDVHVHARVDKRRKDKLEVISPPEAATLPAHDPSTGEVFESTAGPDQGAAGSSPPPDDAPQADRQEPPALPASVAGADTGAITETRSPDPEPQTRESLKLPTREDGRAGERTPDHAALSPRDARSDEHSTPIQDAASQACVDGDASALTPAEAQAVPRRLPPQAGCADPLPVTPAPDGGVGAGTDPDGFGAKVKQLISDAGLRPRVPDATAAAPSGDDDGLAIPLFLRGQVSA